jgi:hypothetical protein
MQDDAGLSETAHRVLPARCKPGGQGQVVGPGGAGGEPEIGDAIAYPGGYAVGLVRRSAAGRVAAAAFLEPGANAVSRVVDLGLTPDDAPPPRLAWRSGELLVAAYGTAGGGAQADKVRELLLYTLTPAANPTLLLSVPQRRDDSLAFDMASSGRNAVVVWDEAMGAARGVVREAVVAPGDHSVRPRDVSPAESDAELPRVVVNGSGYSALWIARAPDPSVLPAGSGGSGPEAVGETRANGWIESIDLDERGEPSGRVRTLTPHNGHVSGYDVEGLVGVPTPWLIVVARDDGEAKDGSGGVLLRVRVLKDTVEPPVAFAIDGLGRGAPTLVPFAFKWSAESRDKPSDARVRDPGTKPGGTWLAWVDAHEQLRLLPLDETGSPRGLPSVEEDMNEARPLLFLPQAEQADGGALVYALAAAPSKADAQLRIFACTP